MFETWCNFSATKIASSCRDKNRLCKRAFSRFKSEKWLQIMLIRSRGFVIYYFSKMIKIQFLLTTSVNCLAIRLCEKRESSIREFCSQAGYVREDEEKLHEVVKEEREHCEASVWLISFVPLLSDFWPYDEGKRKAKTDTGGKIKETGHLTQTAYTRDLSKIKFTEFFFSNQKKKRKIGTKRNLSRQSFQQWFTELPYKF